MRGAILGDIIGEPYEFDRGDKTKDFPLFDDYPEFTDDTVMTAAVAKSLFDTPFAKEQHLFGSDMIEKSLKKELIKNFHYFGKIYPDSGYGGTFKMWLTYGDDKPYNSYGNGAAMRVSPVGWLFVTLEQTEKVAKWTAEVTHNHPEGIKGAQATAAAIYMARNNYSKEKIKKYISKKYNYNLDRTLDEIRPEYHHIESCQETVPEAIIAFLESNDFEDAIRNAVSLGGDTDTLAAITGSIAEAYYGIPKELIEKMDSVLDDEIKEVIKMFDTVALKK